MCLRELLPLHSCERIFTCILIYMHVFLQCYLFIFGCAGSSFLHGLFSICGRQGLLSSCHVRAFHCSSFSYGAGALGCISSVVMEHCTVQERSMKAVDEQLSHVETQPTRF